MPLKAFITILDRGTFQVSDIQAVTVNGASIKIFLRNRDSSFEFGLPNADDAIKAFTQLAELLE